MTGSYEDAMDATDLMMYIVFKLDIITKDWYYGEDNSYKKFCEDFIWGTNR